MHHTTPWRLSVIVVAASLAVLGACSTDSSSTAPAAVPATAQPETVIGEHFAETEGTVQAIDAKTRKVTLLMLGGNTEVVQAPADADLTRLKTGDVVLFGAYQRLSVRAAPPGSAPLGVRRETGMAKAEPGQTPGRAVAELTRIVSEVAAIDLANNRVTLRGADGGLRTLDVKNPDNQRKLQTLKMGDLVEIDLIEVVAVALKPKS